MFQTAFQDPSVRAQSSSGNRVQAVTSSVLPEGVIPGEGGRRAQDCLAGPTRKPLVLGGPSACTQGRGGSGVRFLGFTASFYFNSFWHVHALLSSYLLLLRIK